MNHHCRIPLLSSAVKRFFQSGLFLLGLLLFMHPGAAATGAQNPYVVRLNLASGTVSPTLKLLAMPGFQQTTDYTCGPACLVTFLQFWNKLGPKEMEIAKEVSTSCTKGTKPLAMARWLEKRGFTVVCGEAGSPDKHGLTLLRRALDAGIPPIVEWIDWGGHWAIMAGFDDLGNTDEDDDVIVLSDPYDRHDGVVDGYTLFNAQRFQYMWFDALCFGRLTRGAYILAVPSDDRAKVRALRKILEEQKK